MPYNGAGTYSPPPPPVFPAVTGELIRAADYNAVIADIAAALTNCLTKDNQTTVPLLTLVSLVVTGVAALGAGSTVGGEAILTRRYSTGEVVTSFSTTAPAGTVPMLAGTIGSASSGGTTRANADTQPLFELLWNGASNALLPIQDAAGGASTRGLSAAADFAANKRMPLPTLADGETPVASVSSVLFASTVGEQLSHSHTGSAAATGSNHIHGIWGDINTDSDNTGSGAFPTLAQQGREGTVYTDNDGAHTHTVTIDSAGGAKNKAAGRFVKYYIAL